MEQGISCCSVGFEAEAKMYKLNQGIKHGNAADGSIGRCSHSTGQELAAADDNGEDGKVDAGKGHDLRKGLIVSHLQNLQQNKEHDPHKEHGQEQRRNQNQRTCLFHAHSPTFLPHWLQNLEPGSSVAPHAHTGGARDVPHSGQNLEPADTAEPHPGQTSCFGSGGGGVMEAPQLLQNFAPALFAA